MALRKEKKKTINGMIYERSGQHPTSKRNLAHLQSWARFQHDVNNNDVVIVKEGKGFEAYMRKGIPAISQSRTVTIRTVETNPIPTRKATIRKPKMTKVRVPDGDIMGTGRRRHLRLY